MVFIIKKAHLITLRKVREVADKKIVLIDLHKDLIIPHFFPEIMVSEVNRVALEANQNSVGEGVDVIVNF